MNCQDVQEWISRFADDDLDPALTGPMFAHLGACPECQRYLQTTLRLRNVLAHEPHSPAPDALEQRVMGRLRNTMSAARPSADVWSIRIAIPLPAAMAMTVLLIAGSMVFSPLFFERSPSVRISDETLQQLPAGLRSPVRLTQLILGE